MRTNYPPSFSLNTTVLPTRQVEPQFGNAALKGMVSESLMPKTGKLMRAIDFKEMATSHIDQMKLIYGLCILSRIAAASRRSKNEVREVATRDSMGYTFWFFATPMIQRLFLKAFAPKDIKEALVQKIAKPEATGVMGAVKKLNWMINPVSRYDIATTTQIRNRMTQAVHEMKKAGMTEHVPKVVNFFEKRLVYWRNAASALGVLNTILLLGVGINLYNIAMTKKKVAQGKVGRY